MKIFSALLIDVARGQAFESLANIAAAHGIGIIGPNSNPLAITDYYDYYDEYGERKRPSAAWLAMKPEDRPKRPKGGWPKGDKNKNQKPINNKNQNNKNQNNKNQNNKNQNNNKAEEQYAPQTTTPTPDVDECYLGSDNCHYNAQCTNTNGGFTCQCNSGFSGNGVTCTPNDVDECATGQDQCHTYATCTNTIGGYLCACNSGYTGNGYSCIPMAVNECTDGSANCHDMAYCYDQLQGYSCQCIAGWSGNGVTCTQDESDGCGGSPCSNYASCVATDSYGSFACTCNNGFSGSGVGANGCMDIDECYQNTDNCADDATCSNTIGGFMCSCGSGYSGNGYSCEQDDVDECAEGTDNCDDNASCYNTDSGYTCTCNAGFSGDGVYCVADATSAPPAECDCHPLATCVETAYATSCVCNSGYEGDGTMDGSGCTDIDECEPCGGDIYSPGATCPCSEPTPVCENTNGSYTCGVNTAYGDPHFRVTTPGQEPLCIDLNAKSGTILDLFSAGESTLEVNAFFKNADGAHKQFIKAVGVTTPRGLQLAITDVSMEIYQDGNLMQTPSLLDPIKMKISDAEIVIAPANHEIFHNRHVVDIRLDSGPKFRISVKPSRLSMSFEVVSANGIRSPLGVIGQFLQPGFYTTDKYDNIHTRLLTIPAKERSWHAEHMCHQIPEGQTEAILGHPVSDYQVKHLFEQLFKRRALPAQMIGDNSPK